MINFIKINSKSDQPGTYLQKMAKNLENPNSIIKQLSFFNIILSLDGFELGKKLDLRQALIFDFETRI